MGNYTDWKEEVRNAVAVYNGDKGWNRRLCVKNGLILLFEIPVGATWGASLPQYAPTTFWPWGRSPSWRVAESAPTWTNAGSFVGLQGGPKKVNPKCSTHNFVKYWPILICNAVVINYSTTPQTHRYTTLWNVYVRKLACLCDVAHSEWLIHRNMYSMKIIEYLMLKQKKMSLT